MNRCDDDGDDDGGDDDDSSTKLWVQTREGTERISYDTDWNRREFCIGATAAVTQMVFGARATAAANDDTSDLIRSKGGIEDDTGQIIPSTNVVTDEITRPPSRAQATEADTTSSSSSSLSGVQESLKPDTYTQQQQQQQQQDDSNSYQTTKRGNQMDDKQTTIQEETELQTKTSELTNNIDESKQTTTIKAMTNSTEDISPQHTEFRKEQIKDLIVELEKDENEIIQAQRETEELKFNMEQQQQQQQGTQITQQRQQELVKETQKLIDKIERDEIKAEEDTSVLIQKLEQLQGSATESNTNILEEPNAQPSHTSSSEAAEVKGTTTTPSQEERNQFMKQLQERIKADKDYVSMLDYQKKRYGAGDEDFFAKLKDAPALQEEFHFFEKLQERIQSNRAFKALYDDFLRRFKSGQTNENI